MNKAVLHTKLTTEEKHLLKKWSIVYGVMFLIIWYYGNAFKSGPCTPNLDVLSWFVASIFSFTFLIGSAIHLIRIRDREAALTLFVQAVGFTLLLVYGFI